MSPVEKRLFLYLSNNPDKIEVKKYAEFYSINNHRAEDEIDYGLKRMYKASFICKGLSARLLTEANHSEEEVYLEWSRFGWSLIHLVGGNINFWKDVFDLRVTNPASVQLLGILYDTLSYEEQKIPMSVSEFRGLLGCLDSYLQFSRFKSYIYKPALEELRNRLGMKIYVTVIRENQTPVKVVISYKKEKKDV